MSAQIIKLTAKNQHANVSNVHSSLVATAIRAIKSNLTDHSIEHLIPFIAAAASSPEFLCRVQNQQLWSLQDAINAEIQYRVNEAQA